MVNYTAQRKFGDSHSDQIYSIFRYLGKVGKFPQVDNIAEAPPMEDMQHGTDLIVSFKNGTKITVALRVRKDTSFRDVTFRVSTVHGYGKSEWEKLKDKNCHVKWYLYCWCDSEDKIIEWVLLDIDKCRRNYLFSQYRKAIPNKYSEEDNWFIPFSIKELETCFEENLIECHKKKPSTT